ncbi:NAD(P)H-quinone oxidoreductase [Myxococcus sp. CA051A]|uniref:NAD(P)H-quinone oxidoreductase n=1 Tax=unclassified Myxococcus TaxID=2648731 RepID=UPI00157A472D|nr:MULTISPECIES: NAD(P)H-quinone oxidoreductase [unclassified Myxococcus]NTX13875.1 NAD(P)H-quinone oxidoreductase [Myxococcus sp. CA056]NTX36871.1 NAD(P)H-quinone oxidoreductase [Myxococcus sp. CA033]NTX51073.1 NAD(P)H-quinone oxidoreductase [Myxococcus sp. CA039A]NTX62491.1 NAD(P)H-quinone oxidoreductase [Myxococcus sp. CA051A]
MRTTEVMTAVVVRRPGGPEQLHLAELPRPVPGPHQLLVRVRASALNRTDTTQRAGGYALPPDVTSPLLGVEVSGVVEAVGVAVRSFAPGQRVFGLVDGGGYAEACLMEEGMAVLMPEGWSFVEAAATPEAYCTAHESLLELGGLGPGQSVLVHAGGSGIGTACIQVARAVGARVFVTVGSEEKKRRCLELGADAGVVRTQEDFAPVLARWTDGRGVDLVEDFVGGAALERNLASLRLGGCLLLVGLMDGMRGDVDLKQVVLRRLQIKGMALRPLPLEAKAAVTRRFQARWLPELVAGRVRPIIDSTFPLARVAEAHRHMESNASFGKIVLEV